MFFYKEEKKNMMSLAYLCYLFKTPTHASSLLSRLIYGHMFKQLKFIAISE